MKLTVQVLVSQWAWTDPDEAVVLPGGEHELPNDDLELTPDLVRALASAIAAGSLELVHADAPARKALARHVESDEDSLAAQAKAQADRRWLEGHLEDYIAQAENTLLQLNELAGDLDPEEHAERVERARQARAHGEDRLAELRAGRE
jgi:hypothetical protein